MSRRAPKSSRRSPSRSPEGSYGFADVVNLTTATRSNLIHWTNIGIITPAIEDTTGPGYPRRFSLENVVEVELCAAVNRFKVPATLIADAAETFRNFHQRNMALTNNGSTGDRKTLTPTQRAAYLAQLTEELLQRDKKLQIRTPKDRYASVLEKALERSQGAALRWAAGWERYRADREFREQYFCGVFVVPTIVAYDGQPLEQFTHVAQNWTKPLDMNGAVSWHAIVINLGTVLKRIERTTGARL